MKHERHAAACTPSYPGPLISSSRIYFTAGRKLLDDPDAEVLAQDQQRQ